MRLLKVASRQVFKKKASLLLVCLQIFMTILLVSGVLSFSSSILDLELLFDNTGIQKFSLYTPELTISPEPFSEKEGQTIAEKTTELRQLDGQAEWGVVGYSFMPEYENNDGLLKCMVINDVVANQIKLPLSAGNWFHQQQDTETSAIISTDLLNKLSLNQIYNVKIGYDHTVTEKVKIIGVLGEDNKMISLSGNKATALFENNFSGLLLLPGSESKLMDDFDWEYNNFLILPAESSKEIGGVTPIREMMAEFLENNKQLIGVAGVFAFMAVILSLAGIGASSALKTRYDLKKYTLYFFCGARWKECIYMELVQALITFFLASAPILIIYGCFYQALSGLCKPLFLFIGIGAAVFIYFPAAFIKILTMLKSNPVEVLKEE